jgi:hypothetical protein
MRVDDFGGTKPGFILGLHADLDARGMATVGASYRSGAKTSGTLVIGGDVPAALSGQTSRPFTFSVPQDASVGVAVRPVPGMTIAAEAQWIDYGSIFDRQLPIQSFSGFVGPLPGFPVEGALAQVSPSRNAWVPRVGLEYVAAAGATRVSFRVGYHLEPAHGATAALVFRDVQGQAFSMTDPPFSSGVGAVFDGGKADNRFSGAHTVFYGTEIRWTLTEEAHPFDIFIAKDVRTVLQVAVFYEMGSVADQREALGDVYRSSYGAGFRMVTASGIVFRADVASGREGIETTIIIGYPWESF